MKSIKISFIGFIILLYASCATNVDNLGSAVIVSSGADVFEQPAASAQKLFKIPGNAKVTILKKTEKTSVIKGSKCYWYFVQYTDKEGWVFGIYLLERNSDLDLMIGEWIMPATNVPETHMYIFDDGKFDFPGNFFPGINAIGKGQGFWQYNQQDRKIVLQFSDKERFKKGLKILEDIYKKDENIDGGMIKLLPSQSAIEIDIKKIRKQKNIFTFSGYGFKKASNKINNILK